MNEQTLHELQAVRENPALSILLPTYYKSSDDLQQNPVRFKKLMRQAIDQLLEKHSKTELKSLLENLDTVAESIDFDHPKKGLAVFASNSVGRSYPLLFSVDEQVVIDETFATRHLVHARNRSKRYYLLLLTQGICRLYDCHRDELREIQEKGFPRKSQQDGVDTEWTGDFGVDSDSYDTRHAREFIRLVDESLDAIIGDNDLPLIIAGVQRNLAFFDKVSKHKNRLIGTVEGNYEKAPVPELSAIVWGAARQGFDSKRKKVLAQLDNAVGTKQFASGIDGVWRMAQEGRVATLLVEEGFHYPAAVSDDGLSIKGVPENYTHHTVADAVDEVIETVLKRKGQVVFQENGALDNHKQIAAITRF
ncbi:MAG: hypothetical protein ABI210_10865 [Abditibacteriaceae bacterium]